MYDFQIGGKRNLYDFEKYECELCNRDLVTQDEIDRGICGDCYEDSPWEQYLKYGVSPGKNRGEDGINKNGN